jgi:hypothetical protein
MLVFCQVYWKRDILRTLLKGYSNFAIDSTYEKMMAILDALITAEYEEGLNLIIQRKIPV